MYNEPRNVGTLKQAQNIMFVIREKMYSIAFTIHRVSTSVKKRSDKSVAETSETIFFFLLYDCNKFTSLTATIGSRVVAVRDRSSKVLEGSRADLTQVDLAATTLRRNAPL